MKVTRIRDLIAAIFVLCLVLALIAGVMMALGKPVPFVGRFLGK